ncbi:unnamed protein product [Cylindrotheca closterium]|uniref:Uncharacterized protein n=1 Tax=Cylindrotheca closterium TaxID=2856 RepID=A0AAD2CQZ4_9STRA|nr:unnamed protein product [Cylindrotheca closterium]
MSNSNTNLLGTTHRSSTGDLSTDSFAHSMDSSVASNVSFGKIEIREYGMVLGDNPSTSSGPSVELDWETQSKFTIDTVDQYESMKPRRREMKQLAMPSEFRMQLLVNSGYSLREIRTTIDDRNSLRRKTEFSNKVSNLFSRK